jgi:hypothetical protein
MNKITIALLGLALPVMGQSAPAKTDTPTLTKTELLAVTTLQQEFSTLQKAQAQAGKDLQEFQTEVAVAHPGYFFDPQKGLIKKEDKPVVKAPDVKSAPAVTPEKK